MKLVTFRVTNFRSVNDSGEITVSQLTALVGRNESGKTNLLLALQSLNPPGGPKDLSPIKDFPRQRLMSECTPTTPVVYTHWNMDENEQAYIAELFPRAKGISQLEIGRRYKAASYWVGFRNLKPVEFDHSKALSTFRKLKQALKTAGEKLDSVPQSQLEAAIKKAEDSLLKDLEPENWAAAVEPGLAALRQTVTSTGADRVLDDTDFELLAELENLAQSIIADDEAHLEARKWVISQLPVFVYVDEYAELEGHQNVDEYLHRKKTGQPTPADINFEKLCKVAALDPQQLANLLVNNDHETRNQLANRAGAVVTGEIRRLWKDRALKVRFNPDAAHLDTLISDPNALYDVEVNLDERSRGFKWFFSFYVTFAADTKGGSAENAVLLLDEPGLYLHATSQADLLKHLSGDYRNQVLYTTHSPFMVPTDNLDAVRTVNIHQEDGTTVSNAPSGDARTLFPIQAALGYNISQALFLGPANLVIEGVTDYWILSSVSEYFRSIGHSALPVTLTLTPAGGAPKVSYMVALLTSEKLNVMVLLDDEGAARRTKDELIKQKLIRDDNVMFITEAFEKEKPLEADVEDLLDPAVYESLIKESYAVELKGKSLPLNNKRPRIVKRYEDAFTAVGLEFNKTRPARLLLQKMANAPESIVTPLTKARFVSLFTKIAAQLERHIKRSSEPFR